MKDMVYSCWQTFSSNQSLTLANTPLNYHALLKKEKRLKDLLMHTELPPTTKTSTWLSPGKTQLLPLSRSVHMMPYADQSILSIPVIGQKCVY